MNELILDSLFKFELIDLSELESGDFRSAYGSGSGGGCGGDNGSCGTSCGCNNNNGNCG